MHAGMRTDDFDFALLQKQKLDSVGSYKTNLAMRGKEQRYSGS